MCGIAGFTDHKTIANPLSLMEQMLACLERRGPDGQGSESFSGAGATWRLGHRRLSIIDLEGGKQPISNERRTVAVTFNGEIYNFQALREQLLVAGHSFSTRSDTEVLVHGYEQWGIDGLLSRIEGMYAFCLVDLAANQTHLAVDPMGQKPLFYSHSPHGLAFASTLKALLQVPWVSSEPDQMALRIGVALRYVPAPFCSYKDVRRLAPGTFATFTEKDFSIRKYWSSQSSAPWIETDLPRQIDAVHQNLLHSVEQCLVSDVPVVLLLSSGLDSSLVAAMIGELGRARDIPAITVAFREKSFDESAGAALVARKFGIRHETVLLEELDAGQALETALEMQDEPFADPSLLPTLVLSQAVRRHAKVALGGDGGDELFCGYPTFSAIRPFRLLSSFPASSLLKKVSSLLPASHERYSFSYKLDRFCRPLHLPRDLAYLVWLFTSDLETLAGVLGADSDRVLDAVHSLVEEIDEPDDVKLMSLQYLRLFLPGVLNKVDMASMYHGLEIRAPFLQPSMIRLALSLPSAVKVKNGQQKYIMRQMARTLGLLQTSRLQKQGFNVPLSQWITGKMKPVLEKYISSESLAKTGFFEPEIAADLWRQHQTGRRNHFDLLWSIICTQHFLLKH